MTKASLLLASLTLLPACNTPQWNYPPKTAAEVSASVRDETDSFSGIRTVVTPTYHFFDEKRQSIEGWWLVWRGDEKGSLLSYNLMSDGDRQSSRCLAKGGAEVPIRTKIESRGHYSWELLSIDIPEAMLRSETKDGLEFRVYGVSSLDIWIPKQVIEGFIAAVESRGLRLYPSIGQ